MAKYHIHKASVLGLPPVFPSVGYMYACMYLSLKKYYGGSRPIWSDHEVGHFSTMNKVKVKRDSYKSVTTLPGFCLGPSTYASFAEKLTLKLIGYVTFLANLKLASGKDFCFLSSLKKARSAWDLLHLHNLKGRSCAVLQIHKQKNPSIAYSWYG